jgi:K+-transporting ATPase ATPase C chain
MKNFIVALRSLLFFTLFLGFAYPLVVTGMGKLLYPYQANGEIIEKDGKTIGSELIGQVYQDPKNFWGRTQDVSNASPNSQKNRDFVEARKKAGFQDEMLYASGSGFDPHIRPASALLQIERIVKANRVDQLANADDIQALTKLVQSQIEGPQFFLFGEPRVNVLKLNLKLKEWLGAKTKATN